MYQRKTEDEYDIIADYGCGPEVVTTETNWKDLKEQLKCYRENEPGIKFTWEKHRVKKAVPA